MLASHNYPFGSSTPYPITIAPFDSALGHICYAGVSQSKVDSSEVANEADKKVDSSSSLLASGGRVALAIGVASTLAQARDNAYTIANAINFEGKLLRTDIADKALKA